MLPILPPAAQTDGKGSGDAVGVLIGRGVSIGAAVLTGIVGIVTVGGVGVAAGVTRWDERLDINAVFSVRGDGLVVEFDQGNIVPTELCALDNEAINGKILLYEPLTSQEPPSQRGAWDSHSSQRGVRELHDVGRSLFRYDVCPCAGRDRSHRLERCWRHRVWNGDRYKLCRCRGSR